MARRRAKVGLNQRLAGFGILAVLGAITIWLLIQQAYFNPAVLVASRAVQVEGRAQAGAGQEPGATAAFLPEVSGFKTVSPIQSYGPQKLSDKINGKAELYLSAGFKEMSCRSFQLAEGEKAYVEAFVYDMGSPQNAYAVFSGQRRPNSPSSDLTVNAYTTANALFFTQGQYYVEIVGDRASPALQDALKTYANAVLEKLPSEGGAGPQDRTKLFPQEGLARDTVRLSPSDTFGMAGFNNVLTAEYTFKDGYATAFLAGRDSEEQAQKDAQRYREFLLGVGYKKIQPPGAPEGSEVLTLEDSSYEIILVQDKMLAGVHDASSSEVAVDLANKLTTALKENK